MYQINLMTRFMMKIKPNPVTDCWEWTGSRLPSGYGRINIDQKIKRAHRVGYELFIGVIPDGLFACHKCDNPSCVNPWHMFLGTYSDNTQDMLKKNRHNPQRGEDNFHAKLTKEQVREIRELYKTGKYTHRSLAAQFKVGKSSISNLLCGRKWKHII